MQLINVTERHNDRGFTLVELLAALAITGLVMSLAGSGLYTLMKANDRSQSETNGSTRTRTGISFYDR